jgi:hypothetical protein
MRQDYEKQGLKKMRSPTFLQESREVLTAEGRA